MIKVWIVLEILSNCKNLHNSNGNLGECYINDVHPNIPTHLNVKRDENDHIPCDSFLFTIVG